MTRSPIAEPASLARIAASELTQRIAASQVAVAAGTFGRDAANANAQLWLAIALEVGADIPVNIGAQIVVECIWPAGKIVLPRADQIADPAATRTELARARDVAIAKASANPTDLAADQRARDLIALAEALGAPPIDWRRANPMQERKAA